MCETYIQSAPNPKGPGNRRCYDFDIESYTPVGDALIDPRDGTRMADVVITHRRSGHGTTFHHTVSLPAETALGRSRAQVIAKARSYLPQACLNAASM